jgi:hypothetical protein
MLAQTNGISYYPLELYEIFVYGECTAVHQTLLIM